jgi:hypothetical protein
MDYEQQCCEIINNQRFTNMAIKTNKEDEKKDRIVLLTELLTRLASSDTSYGVSELGRELSKNYYHLWNRSDGYLRTAFLKDI